MSCGGFLPVGGRRFVLQSRTAARCDVHAGSWGYDRVLSWKTSVEDARRVVDMQPQYGVGGAPMEYRIIVEIVSYEATDIARLVEGPSDRLGRGPYAEVPPWKPQ